MNDTLRFPRDNILYLNFFDDQVTALTGAMAELGLRSGTIVTRDEQETVPVDAGAIEIVPAWRFLLDSDG